MLFTFLSDFLKFLIYPLLKLNEFSKKLINLPEFNWVIGKTNDCAF